MGGSVRGWTRVCPGGREEWRCECVQAVLESGVECVCGRVEKGRSVWRVRVCIGRTAYAYAGKGECVCLCVCVCVCVCVEGGRGWEGDV